jgi:AcrR family transcriptional regulator
MAPRPAPSLSLRERKKLRTQHELQAAALQLFVEHGFDQVTTDDIAAAAEVSKTTFYRYFGSKEDVLLGDPEADLRQVRAALNDRPRDEPVLDSVRNAILGLAAGVQHDRAAMLARGRLMRTTSSLMARYLEHQAALEQVMIGFIAERRGADPRTDLAVRLLGAHTVTALRVTVDFWLDHDGSPDLADLVHQALGLLAGDPDGALTEVPSR